MKKDFQIDVYFHLLDRLYHPDHLPPTLTAAEHSLIRYVLGLGCNKQAAKAEGLAILQGQRVSREKVSR